MDLKQLSNDEVRIYAKAWLAHKEEFGTDTTNVELKAFEAAFIAAIKHKAAQLAALQAERDALREAQFKAVKDLKRMARDWRDYAAGHYCQTYNPERGKGLNSAADHLENYINDTIQLAQAHEQGEQNGHL